MLIRLDANESNQENSANTKTAEYIQQKQYYEKLCVNELAVYNENKFYSDIVLLIEVSEYLIDRQILPLEVDLLGYLARLTILVKWPSKIDKKYFLKLRILLENLIKNDLGKSREMVQFCIEHLKFCYKATKIDGESIKGEIGQFQFGGQSLVMNGQQQSQVQPKLKELY